ncbi:MAG TPA: VOC family protein [Acidobacteriota bacterium]|nr:VOC family protein [Acidobacteriota bacterium]
MAVKPIPEGYHTITPYFVVTDAEKFLDFAKRAFGATEVFRADMPDGSIAHAELQIGDSRVMLGQASEQWKPTTCSLYLYVPDVDAVYRSAMQAGATSMAEPEDKFYGDRTAGVRDPFGNQWWLGTHIEDVSPDELNRRMQEQMSRTT